MDVTVWLVAQNAIWGLPIEDGSLGVTAIRQAYTGPEEDFIDFYLMSLQYHLKNHDQDPLYISRLKPITENSFFRHLLKRTPLQSKENYTELGIN